MAASATPREMQRVSFRAREELRIERVPVPEPRPGEVRVRVRACGICGSDLHLYRVGPIVKGITPGHEFAGVVDELGAGTLGFAEGDLVAVEPLASCGNCPQCDVGRDAICRANQCLGIQCDGGLAEYVTVPARRLFRLPTDLDPRLAALTEPIAVAVHGLRRGRLEPGQRVLVLGAGSVGLLTALAARAMGAGDVWITARYPHQAELAADLGASRVIGEEDTTNGTLDKLALENRVDLVVETVGGTANTLRVATSVVGPGGIVSVLGLFMGDVSLAPWSLLMKETTLTWSNCYEHPQEGADFDEAVRILDADRERLARLLTHAVPLADAPRAFTLAGDKKAGAVKVTVVN